MKPPSPAAPDVPFLREPAAAEHPRARWRSIDAWLTDCDVWHLARMRQAEGRAVAVAHVGVMVTRRTGAAALPACLVEALVVLSVAVSRYVDPRSRALLGCPFP